MVRKFKKKTLFFAGIIGLSLLSLFGIRSGSQGDGAFTETDLKDLLVSTPVAHADYLDGTFPFPTTGGGDHDGGGPSGGDSPGNS